MEQKQQFSGRCLTQPIAMKAFTGAAAAALVIIFLLSTVDNPNPAWGKYWMIRPLVFVPLAGAGGGLMFHFVRNFGPVKRRLRVLSLLLGVLVYIFALWMGIVIGLDGTLWN